MPGTAVLMHTPVANGLAGHAGKIASPLFSAEQQKQGTLSSAAPGRLGQRVAQQAQWRDRHAQQDGVPGGHVLQLACRQASRWEGWRGGRSVAGRASKKASPPAQPSAQEEHWRHGFAQCTFQLVLCKQPSGSSIPVLHTASANKCEWRHDGQVQCKLG